MATTKGKKIKGTHKQDNPFKPIIIALCLSVVACVTIWVTFGWKVCALFVSGALLFAGVKLLRDYSLAPKRIIDVIYTILIILGPAVIAVLAVFMII